MCRLRGLCLLSASVASLILSPALFSQSPQAIKTSLEGNLASEKGSAARP